MHEDDFYSEIEKRESLTQRYLGLSWGKFVFAIVAVIGMGIYIGILLFGDNSLEILLGLEEYETYLEEEVDRLKQENAGLQKEYFELKELERDSRHD